MKLHEFFLGVISMCFLSACSEQMLNWNAAAVDISGKVLGISSFSITPLCTGAVAKIYKLDSNGEVVTPELGRVAVGVDGTYTFNAKEVGVRFVKGVPNVPIVVNIEACDEILSRPITGQKEQNVSQGSTLLGYVLNTSEKQKLAETLLENQEKINELISFLESSSTVGDAYTNLTGNYEMKSSFIEVLGVSPTILADASPQVLSVSVPSTGSELQAVALSAVSTHWSPSYDAVYLWKVDNDSISTSASVNYTPSANFQGTHVVKLYIGKNNGSGGVDLTKPYKLISREIQIQNTSPAMAPGLSLITSSPTGGTSIDVAIDTGAGKINCATFSKLALTIDEPTAPLDLSRYDITCMQAGSQTQNLNISTGDGTKVIRLWALDANNNISATPSTVSIVLEANPPIVTIQNLASLIRGGSSQTIQYTAADLGVGVEQVILEYAPDGISYSEITSTLDPVATSFSFSWTVPSHNTTSATLRVRAKDRAGNWSTASATNFEIDSLAPTLNLTSFNSGAYLGGSTHNITWTASDLHLEVTPIKIQFSSDSGSTWSSIVAATSNSGSYSWTLPSINSNQVRVKITATDLTGNQTEILSSSALTIDSTAPGLPTVTLTSGSYSNNSTVSLTLSSCADIGKVLINESLVAPAAGAPGWQVCGLTPSYIVSGEGLHTLQVWVQDAVGNVNPISVGKSMTLDTTLPMVSLTSLNMGSFRGGESQDITWSASDLNLSATPIKLEYSSNDGSSWNTILASTANSGTYAWTLPSINSTQVKVRVTIADLAANENSAVSSSSLSIDSTAPAALSLTRTSTSPHNLTTVDIAVANCTGDSIHMIFKESSTTPSVADAGWEPCSGSKMFNVSSGDGTKTIYAWAKDAVGNLSTVSNVTMILDTAAPTLTLKSHLAGAFPGGTTQVISWNSVDANFIVDPIKIEYSDDDGGTWQLISVGTTNGSNSCTLPSGSTGCFNWNIPSVDSTQYRIRVTATDLVGQSSIVASTSAFIVDSTVPVLSAFDVNNGTAATSSSTIPTALTAQDNISKITHFCLKYTMGISAPVHPSGGDACWTSVNAPSPGISPELNINFSNHFYSIGLTNGDYRVYAWVKNEAGLISTISNADAGTLGVDYSYVEYAPGAPATVVNVIAVNNDTHATPPIAAETTVSSGQTLIVKWKATDDVAFPNNNIKLYYTLNETAYTLMAENLSNQANGGCTVDGINYTGCYVTTAPTGAYFKIRISVQDASQKVSLASAIPNNLGSFRILAGNTETGIGGSANSAVFNIMSGGTTTGLPGTLVVTDDGTVFVRDIINGILKINPSTGLVQSYIPTTGTITDGPIGTATLRNAGAIMTVDFSNNLLIMDYDRIRKVNTTTNTVTTLIGGGASRTSGVSATSFQLNASSGCGTCTMSALPNGDILFFDGLSTSKIIWRYTASDQKVYGINLSGTGIANRPVGDDVSSADYLLRHFSIAYDVTNSEITTMMTQYHPVVCPACGAYGYPAFIDPNTGSTISSPTPTNFQSANFKPTITSRDGKIYQISVESTRRLGRYNADTNTWSPLVGTGSIGFCEDGTDALSCNVNVMDGFVTADSRIFFIDNGLIRTVDSSNKVRTVFGQRLTYGDGGLATSARIQMASFFDFTSIGDVVFLDGMQNVVRKFSPSGNIEAVMGNGNSASPTVGSPALGSPLIGSWWGGRFQVLVDQATDNIYVNLGTWIAQILNSDKKIYRVLGLGGTNYAAADGLSGTSITIAPNESAQMIGLQDGKLYMAMSQRNGSAQNYRCYMKQYDITNNFVQSHIAGNDNLCVNTYPTVGSATETANTGNMSSNMHLAAQWNSDVGGWINPRTGTTSLLAYVPGGVITAIKTGLPRMYSSMTLVKNASNQNVLYYCAAGRIYKYNIATSTETQLGWPSSAYSCAGFTIRYSASRGSVVFPITQNGLTAIVEIVDTP